MRVGGEIGETFTLLKISGSMVPRHECIHIDDHH